MKVRLSFERESIGKLAVALILASVLFVTIGFSFAALLGFGACFFLIINTRLELDGRLPWLWTILTVVLSAVFTAYHVQYLLLDDELRAKLSQEKMALNILCCMVVFWAVLIFTNQLAHTCVISHLFFMVMAGIDYFVYLFRGNEFIFSDLRSIQTGLSVAGNYEFVLDARAGYVILVSTLYIAFVRRLHVTFQKRLPMGLIAFSFAVLCGVYVGQQSAGTVTETWEQKGSYRNGYILNFVLSVRDSFVAEPEGYSAEAVAALEEVYGAKEQLPVSSLAGKRPTVIVVMNESYADLSVAGDFLTNTEPAPFFQSLTENTVRGYALSSVFGAKTPNSEWEFLTGNTMAFLPGGSVVYQQYISDEPDSLVGHLKGEGYTCVAMHPYYETGWSRNVVYPDMGFDEMYFLDAFDQTQLLRKYVTDRELYREIIARYERRAVNEDLFIMSISMQNHGGYTEHYDNFNEQVRVLGMQYEDADQYLSLVHESDAALEYLISYFSEVEDPVEIVFFGDHQPSLSNGFYRSINGKGLSGLTMDELETLYTVPFFIWTNYDSAEREVEMTSLNYLSTLALEQAGLPLSAYQRFLRDMMEEIPAINARGYYSRSQGGYVHVEDARGEEAAWLRNYAILQYNNMFDDKGRSTVFFPLVK